MSCTPSLTVTFLFHPHPNSGFPATLTKHAVADAGLEWNTPAKSKFETWSNGRAVGGLGPFRSWAEREGELPRLVTNRQQFVIDNRDPRVGGEKLNT